MVFVVGGVLDIPVAGSKIILLAGKTIYLFAAGAIGIPWNHRADDGAVCPFDDDDDHADDDAVGRHEPHRKPACCRPAVHVAVAIAPLHGICLGSGISRRRCRYHLAGIHDRRRVGLCLCLLCSESPPVPAVHCQKPIGCKSGDAGAFSGAGDIMHVRGFLETRQMAGALGNRSTAGRQQAVPGTFSGSCRRQGGVVVRASGARLCVRHHISIFLRNRHSGTANE